MNPIRTRPNVNIIPSITALADGRPLLDAFLEDHTPQTLRAYAFDLGVFARFVGAPTVDAALVVLLAAGPGQANQLAHAYRARLVESGLSPATVNRRLAALRSVVKLARTFGRTTVRLDVPGVKSIPFRNTRGPGASGVRKLLEVLATRKKKNGQPSARAVRDVALVRVMFDLALRRAEVCSLDLADVDLKAGTVKVVGKGRHEPESVTLPTQTRKAIAAWLKVRGTKPGPLFTRFRHDTIESGRLTGSGLAQLVRKLGATVEIPDLHPHALRHASITAVLDASSGNVRDASKFARHAAITTTMRYDDARTDAAGRMAQLAADALNVPVVLVTAP